VASNALTQEAMHAGARRLADVDESNAPRLARVLAVLSVREGMRWRRRKGLSTCVEAMLGRSGAVVRLARVEGGEFGRRMDRV
jgi:hypothetical protein